MGVDGMLRNVMTVSNLEGILIVEKAMAEEMRSAGLRGLEEAYPAILRSDWPCKTNQKALAKGLEYVWFRIKADIQVNFAETRRPPGIPGPQGIPWRKVPVPGSHGGADIFGVQNMEWTFLFCTFRFVELARQRKWKGFLFEPMDVPDKARRDATIRYLDKPWPPERWYPEGETPHPDNLESDSG